MILVLDAERDLVAVADLLVDVAKPVTVSLAARVDEARIGAGELVAVGPVPVEEPRQRRRRADRVEHFLPSAAQQQRVGAVPGRRLRVVLALHPGDQRDAVALRDRLAESCRGAHRYGLFTIASPTRPGNDPTLAAGRRLGAPSQARPFRRPSGATPSSARESLPPPTGSDLLPSRGRSSSRSRRRDAPARAGHRRRR